MDSDLVQIFITNIILELIYILIVVNNRFWTCLCLLYGWDCSCEDLFFYSLNYMWVLGFKI